VEPPPGTRRVEAEGYHRINGQNVGGDGFPITRTAKEEFRVVFEVVDTQKNKICDYHYWACPVTDYEVRMKGQGVHCELLEKIGKRDISIAESFCMTDGILARSSYGAFGGQGLYWSYAKPEAVAC
jgi:hypothetical protein